MTYRKGWKVRERKNLNEGVNVSDKIDLLMSLNNSSIVRTGLVMKVDLTFAEFTVQFNDIVP